MSSHEDQIIRGPVADTGQVPVPPSPGGDVLTPAHRAIHRNFLISMTDLKKNLVRSIFYLRAVVDRQIHRALGFSRIADYTAHYAGLTPRQTREFLILGNRLGDLPDIAAALERGDLTWRAAREIAHRATPDNQQELIDLARNVSREELRRRLAASAPPATAANPATPHAPAADLTAAPAPPAKATPSRPLVRRDLESPPSDPRPGHVVRTIAGYQHVTFKLTVEQYAIWEALWEQLRRACPRASSADVLLDALAQAAAAPQAAPAKTSAASAAMPPHLIALLHCPTCRRTAIPTSRGEAEADRALLAKAMCDAVIQDEQGARRATIAPRLRRLAVLRARFRCEAAGCLHTRFLEVHHRRPMTAGGGNALANLIVLCAGCHRRLHRQEALADGQRLAIEQLADQWPAQPPAQPPDQPPAQPPHRPL